MSKNRSKQGPDARTSNDWVEQGTPMDVLRAMVKEPVVATETFHRVYARLMDGGAESRVRALMEELLEISEPEEFDLMKKGMISTMTQNDRMCSPDDCVTFESQAQWAAEHVQLGWRLQEATSRLQIRR